MPAPGVLIVEYDERVSRVLCRIIKRLGHTPLPAADYQAFKAGYLEYQPDIILLSLEMPGNENSEFCRFLVEQQARAAIILLSDQEAEETAEITQLARSAGLNIAGILRNPVDVDSVKGLLEELAARDLPVPLKKNYELGRSSRLETPLMILDPDQVGKRQLCCNLT